MAEKRDAASDASGNNGWACRCLVLVDRQAISEPRTSEAGALETRAVPEALLAGLRRRGAAVRLVTDAATAMVELHQFQAQALIVCRPELTRAVEPFLSAVHVCYPQVVCWRYDPSSNGQADRLAPFHGIATKMPTAEPGPVTQEDQGRSPLEDHAPPFLDPSGESDHDPLSPPLRGTQRLVTSIESTEDFTEAPELSVDELAMLLGPDSDEPLQGTPA